MYESYFDTEVETVDKDMTIYNIFAALTRNAKDLYVINDGPDKMFVQTYSDKRRILSYPTAECWIYPRQTRHFSNVYEVLIAKTPIGNQYRITEFKQTTCQTSC